MTVGAFSQALMRRVFGLALATLISASAVFAQEYKESFNAAIEAAKAKQYQQAYDLYTAAADGARAAGDAEVEDKSNKILSQLDQIFGTSLLKKEDYAGALTRFEHGIGHNPDYAVNYYNRGLALKKLDRTEEAIQSFVEAMNRDDGKVARQAENAVRSHFHAEASRLVAKENPRVSDADQAIEYLDQVQQIVEANADTYYYLANAYSIKGDYEKAVAFADQALEIHRGGRSDRAKIHFLKGEALMYAGNITAAKDEFQEARYGNYKASAEHYLETL
jgi:tetratricopeptide (TPR) repeat protein